MYNIFTPKLTEEIGPLTKHTQTVNEVNMAVYGCLRS